MNKVLEYSSEQDRHEIDKDVDSQMYFDNALVGEHRLLEMDTGGVPVPDLAWRKQGPRMNGY